MSNKYELFKRKLQLFLVIHLDALLGKMNNVSHTVRTQQLLDTILRTGLPGINNTACPIEVYSFQPNIVRHFATCQNKNDYYTFRLAYAQTIAKQCTTFHTSIVQNTFYDALDLQIQPFLRKCHFDFWIVLKILKLLSTYCTDYTYQGQPKRFFHPHLYELISI